MSGRSIFVALESLPGGGKSKFLKTIVPQLSFAHCIYQPLESWFDVGHDANLSDTGVPFNPNIFKLAYEDPKRWNYSFQLWTLMTRYREFQKHQRSISENQFKIVITERSWVTDKIYADFMYENGQMSEIEHSMYEYWWQWFIKEAPAYQGHIFLEEPVNTVLNRIRHRLRSGEERIDFGYVMGLQKKFDEMFEVLDSEGIPVLRINPVDYERKSYAVMVAGHVLHFLTEVIDHGVEDTELAKEMK
eukprot:UN29889